MRRTRGTATHWVAACLMGEIASESAGADRPENPAAAHSFGAASGDYRYHTAASEGLADPTGKHSPATPRGRDRKCEVEGGSGRRVWD
jgi:hypothetical protein